MVFFFLRQSFVEKRTDVGIPIPATKWSAVPIPRWPPAGHPLADCVTVRRRRPGWSGEGWSSPSSSRPPRRHSISALEKSWNVWITRIPGIACRVDFYFVVCLKLNWWCLWMRCFIGTSWGTIWNSRRADCISLQIGSWNLGSERRLYTVYLILQISSGISRLKLFSSLFTLGFFQRHVQ